jgi:hypothetical protein
MRMWAAVGGPHLAVGWRLADHMRTELPLDASEMALWQRQVHKGQTPLTRPGVPRPHPASTGLEYARQPCRARRVRSVGGGILFVRVFGDA